jgi:hypothetical protein
VALGSRVQGQPHTRNVERWASLVNQGDLPGIHRALTGLDRRSIELREVSPFSGLMPDDARLRALRDVG